mmetsp:Transcript_101832/g.294695  ORF Transcript_101832/g.294695 Transcript_101832/m.294695 type:complete len:236 (-) Transcript_101832:128-835(-)
MLSRLAPCCCSDAQDRNQLTFNNAPTTDDSGMVCISEELAGTRPYQASPPGEELARSRPYQASPPAAVSRLRSPHPTEEGSSFRSLTEEEKTAEKDRLQSLVNSFAKRAVRGCPCFYVREGTGERLSTHYRIDKSLGYLLVLSTQDRRLQEVSCPIAAIQDIYSFIEDGEACFPPEVIKHLTPEQKEMLLMVVYRSGARLFRFCLLEMSMETRDVFLECLRVLCIYAQSAPNWAT